MPLVLIVDDHPSVARSLLRLLRSMRIGAHVAHGGAEALAFLDNGHAVALVVLDVLMPGMSGLDVLRELNAPGRRAAAPPVVMFSSNDDPALHDQALRLGAIGVIPKTDTDALLALIRTRLRPPGD